MRGRKLRRWSLPLLVLVGCLALAEATFHPVRRVGQGLRVGSAVVAETLCSQVFVAGLDPARVEAEDLQPQAGLLRRLRIDIDRRHGQVTASWAGRLASVATYRPGLGCGLGAAPAAPGGVPAQPAERTAPAPAEAAQTAAPAAQAPVAAPAGQASATADAAQAPVAALGTQAPITASVARAPVNPPADALRSALDRAFAEPHPERPRHVRAIVVLRDGRLIAERYAPGIGVDTPLLGYSLSKSVINAFLGILVRDGRLQVASRAPLRAWADPADPRHAITVEQLMRMTSGLALEESDSGFDPVSRMLFLEPDMAAFAAGARLKAPPGTAWEYTSGNTLLLSAIVRDAVGGHASDVVAWAHREFFAPLAMRHVTLEFDAAGTPIGSTRILAAARDWARLGQLYLDDGQCGGRRILPPGWVRFSTRPTLDTDYGAGFWVNASDAPHARGRVRGGMPADAFFGSGRLGQRLVVVPSHRLVIARLGTTLDPPDFDIQGLNRLVADVIAATEPPASPPAPKPTAP